MCNKRFFGVLFILVLLLSACTISVGQDGVDVPPSPDMGGGGTVDSRDFKIPIPKGYDWEITQSWKEHWIYCEETYPYNPNDPNDAPYNECSHYIYSSCRYGWDFNLPGIEDRGKPVLASSGGVVYDVDYSDGWGNYVVIDHGYINGVNICTRYAHMLDGSTSHISHGQDVCQGLKIGEIGNTGLYSDGEHLHFQFENCSDPGISIEESFTDGNGVPECVRNNDRYENKDPVNGKYIALNLTNTMVYSCYQSGDTFGGGELPEGGWVAAECGSLSGCPLIPNCGREWGHEFTDQSSLSPLVAKAGAYLYSECALDGKVDGGLHPSDKLTRAEALKVPMFLYGLMDGCGASEPFADVDPGDWYFGVVACAVQNGIIDSVADYFRPNDEVEFAEAAKFVVEAASRAGVIDIQDANDTQAYFPNIPVTHWAYNYAATIYHYGGLDSDSLNFSPGMEIDRGDYFIMVASLSPCYCRNVSCEIGCECDQALTSCVNPDDITPGTGGGDPEDPEDPVEFVPDVSADCYVRLEGTQCIDPNTMLRIECDVTNNGDEVVNINDLGLVMTDSAAASICQVTDDDYRDGVGYNIVSPNETEYISGHFYVTCLERPADGGIDISLDLTHTVTGPDLVFTDVTQTTVSIPEAPFADCYCNGRVCGSNPYGGSCGTCGAVNQSCDNTTGQCVCTPDDCTGRECGPDYCGGFCGFCTAGDICDTASWQCVSSCVPSCAGIVCGWDGCGGVCNSCPVGESCNAPVGQCQGAYQNPWNNCDPAVGYTVFMDSPGGTFEVATSGPTPYLSGTFASGPLYVYFDCVDMPASILIHGGSQYVQAYLQDTSLPNFSFWVPYTEPIVIDPWHGADGSAISLTSTMSGLSLLVRTPNP